MERKELIKITTNEEGKQLVSARELYDGLKIKVHFSTWMKRMCEYGFEEDIDFSILKSGNPNGGIDKIDDYIITVEMAKEICMVQRNELGKQYRLYFIDCEKKLKELSTKANLLLAIYNGGQEGIAASKKLTEMEVAAATKPLLEENKELKIQTQKDKEWFSIKRVAMINNTSWKNYKWKDLKNAGIELGYTVKKVFDANYGEVNAYHIDVWKKVYPEVSFSF